MDNQYWLDKWISHDTGFNQQKPHPLLANYFKQLKLPLSARIFVPLCGMSIDMLWLVEQGYQVVGIELSEIACTTFFETHHIKFKTEQLTDFKLYLSRNITIICGDYFNLTSDILGQVNAIYDRAALIALPPELRVHYVEKMFEVTSSKAKYFLISLTYDANEMTGPPFPVFESEINALYYQHQNLRQIYHQEIKKIAPHLKAKGLTEAFEQLYCSN